MVLVLPEVPSFGQQFARNLGAGVSQGVGNTADFYSKLGVEKLKDKQKRDLIQSIEGGSYQVDPKQMKQAFLSELPKIEQELGRILDPKELDVLWNGFQKMSSGNTQTVQSSQPGTQQQDPFKKAKLYEAAGERGLSNISLEEAKINQQERNEVSKRNFDIAKDTLKRGETLAAELPYKQAALDNMIYALNNKDLSFFSPDNLAEMTGIEGFRSPEGAIFQAAGKEFFMSNLSRVGARGLNQWLERQLRTLQPQIGKSNEANLVLSEIFQADLDVGKKEVELINSIAEDYENKYGYPPRNLSALVTKELSKYSLERQQQAKKQIESIKEHYEPVNKQGQLMRAPDGSLRRVEAKDIKAAKKAGYRVEK